ncbi:hypothetical protein K7432_004606 [Basidiobolus ranarum]|uniref:Myb-like DNA-binding domain containing protein n=1 Tax=Basidiobolus ranarum TaxID=34480 RepID=A0ABR2WY25_9FUNG
METDFLRRELESTKEYYQTTNQDIRLKTHVEESLRSQEIQLLSQKLEESYDTVDRLKKRVLKYKSLDRKQKERKLTKKSVEEPKPIPQPRPYSFIHFEHENPGLPKQNRVECSPSQPSDAINEQTPYSSSSNQSVSVKVHTNKPFTSVRISGGSNFRTPLQPITVEHQTKPNKVAPYLMSTFSCPDIQAKGRSPYVKWTPEEDTLLRKAVSHLGCTNWQQISKEVPGRSYHQCRQRWLKVLKNSVNQNNYKIDPSQIQMTLNQPPLIRNSVIHDSNNRILSVSSGSDLESHDFSIRNANISGMNHLAPIIPSTTVLKSRKDSCPLWQILDN